MDKLQEYHGLVQELSSLADSGILVIVEGKKDMNALEALGVTNVMPINGRPLYLLCESVAAGHSRVVILTDLDREGRKIFGTLSRSLSRLGVQTDNRLRDFLFKHTSLRQIEGLATYISHLRKGRPGPL